MTRVHIVLPPAADAPPRVLLPDFLTDVRPTTADPALASALALAKAADLAGLAGILVRDDPGGPEPLVTAAGLLRATRHVTVFAAVQPWIATPQYTAKLSASLQRFSGGRFGWHVADDADSALFVDTAQDFWRRPDGLPDVLSEHAFPRVVVADTERAVRLDVRGLDPADITALIRSHDGSDVADFFLDVSHDPGETYRIGEYVLPLLSQKSHESESHEQVAAHAR